MKRCTREEYSEYHEREIDLKRDVGRVACGGYLMTDITKRNFYDRLAEIENEKGWENESWRKTYV